MNGTGSSVAGVGAKGGKASHTGLGILSFFIIRACRARNNLNKELDIEFRNKRPGAREYFK